MNILEDKDKKEDEPTAFQLALQGKKFDIKLARKLGIQGFDVTWFKNRKATDSKFLEDYLTQQQINICVQEFKAYLVAGYEKQDIIEFLKINEEDYIFLYKTLLFQERQILLTQDKFENFMRYKMFMERCIHELDLLVRDSGGVQGNQKGDLTAKVNAIRAKAEIYDKIISKGESFGILKTADNMADVTDLVALDNKQLSDVLKRELMSLQKLTSGRNIIMEMSEEEILESDLRDEVKERILNSDEIQQIVDIDEFNDIGNRNTISDNKITQPRMKKIKRIRKIKISS